MALIRLERAGWFLLVSAILVAAIAGLSGLAVAEFFKRHALGVQAEQTASVVNNEARRHLPQSAFIAPSDEAARLFEAFLDELPGVFRIKVFAPDGRIVWSNRAELVGRVFPDNPYLERALRGEVATKLGAPKRAEHVYERDHGWIAEAYVPVRFDGGVVAGVIETYKDASGLMAAIAAMQRHIWMVAGGGGVLVWIGFAMLAWRASRAERRAIASLEASTRELVALQARLADRERLAAVGEMSVGLHHAILNPLAGVAGALAVVRSGELDPAERDHVFADIDHALHTIEDVVRRLETLRHAEATTYVGATKMLDLASTGDAIERAEPGR